MKAIIGAAVLGLALLPATAAAATVAIACGSVGIEQRLCREGAEAWAAATGNAVELVQGPKSASDRLALFQQLLAAESADVDVYQVDVVWPGILGRHLRALDPGAAHFPALIANNTVDGALKAVPWFVDVGLLYYRADLLEKHGRAVPETWDELADTARAVAGAEGIAGFAFQGKAYEGLTCNAVEWIESFGGSLLSPAGAVVLDQPPAVAAIAAAASWIGTVAPEGVLSYGEEEARGLFQSGRAVFMRNWPYAWALVNGPDSPVAGKVGVAPLPKGGAGGRHAAVLGGQGLAVSKYSRHPDLAADLVRWLTRPEEQARRARVAGYNPTIPALYEDPALLAAVPLLARLRPALDAAVARPSRVAGPDYNQFSSIVWNAVHDALAGRASAEAALARAARRLERLARRW